MRAQHRLQHAIDDLAARVQRTQGNVAAGGDDLERRRDRRHVPARIALGVFVAGRKIDPALRIELLQQPAQALFVRDLGNGAFDDDAAGRGIAFGAHKNRWGVSQGYHAAPTPCTRAATLIISQ